MTKNQLWKRAQPEYKIKQEFRKRKQDKNYQLMIERCMKEARNPFYRLFNKIRYKLGILKIKGE